MTRERAPPGPPPPSTPRGPDDPWQALRAYTAARIGLPRSGASLATGPLLELRLAHARARDAVHAPLDEDRLRADLAQLDLPVLALSSAADDARRYLLRPDLGRRLSQESEALLASHGGSAHELAVVVTAGLSAGAVQRHAQPLLARTLPPLLAHGWRIAPLVMVLHGRVAIGDPIAIALRAASVAVLIGERPGLSAPESMGVYLTWQPGPQTTDADRNCISNVRPEGIGYAEAAAKLLHLVQAMRSRRMSGVRLKDDSDSPLIGGGAPDR